MSQFSGFRRVSAVVLSGALALGAVQPASAGPLPMSRDLGATAPVEVVQYRRGPRPAYAPVRRNRGNGGAAAAALAIGALAIGAAAIAASNQRRERVYYEDPYEGGYAPPPPPRAYGYPAYPAYRADQVPDYYAPAPRHVHRPAQIDGGSPYAVQQQRVQNREAYRAWQRGYAPPY